MRTLLFFLQFIFFSLRAQSPCEIDSLKNVLGANDSIDAELYIDILCAYSNENFDSAQHYADLCQTSEYIQSKPLLLARYLGNLGELFFLKSNYGEALDKQQQSLKIYENNQYIKGVAESYKSIGVTHHKIGNDTLSIQYIQKALDIALELGDSFLMADCYMDMGSVLKSSNMALSVEYLEKAYHFFDRNHSYYNLASCSNNLAIIYATRQAYDKAEARFLLSYEAKMKLKHTLGQARTLNNIACLLYTKSKDNKYADSREEILHHCILYTNRALDATKETGSLYTRHNIYANLLNAYSDLGNYKEAMAYQTEFMLAKDSIFNIEKQKNIDDLEAKFQLREKQSQISRLKNEKQLVAIRRTLQLSLSAFLLLMGIVIIIFIQFKRRKDRRFFAQKAIVLEKDKQLVEVNLEKSKAKASELEQTIIYKTKQLSTHALHMIQKNELIQEIHGELSANNSKDNIEMVKRIKSMVERSHLQDNDWEVFKHYFEEVNQQFYDKLYELNPELTTTDQKICALIKLNMSTKEIAAMLNVIPASVKSARYRIKKKLRLDANTDLDDFLRGMN